MTRYVLAIDQGTTGSTALLVDESLRVVAKVNREFEQIYPQPGWVEHEPEAIWASVRAAVTQALAQGNVEPGQLAAIGITNQRETTIVWERTSGRPVHNAVVWQCRRTAEACRALDASGHLPLVRERTGLVLDPYFSATKVAWILDHVDGARKAAEGGELAFGTVDSYLLWRLTGGRVHATDVSNASRTLLMDIHRLAWDQELCDLFQVPKSVLPEIRSSSEVYGHTKDVDFLPDGIPVAGLVGDQQAALFGQACLDRGDAKCTYGTGAFLMLNTGSRPVASEAGLLTTVAWRLGDRVDYALEGSVFIAGAAVQWLRDGLGIIASSPEIESLARQVQDSGGVVFVPALAGLGAPHWNPDARGLILGLSRGSTKAHLARATLEGIALSVDDVLQLMSQAVEGGIRSLKVDGGAAANDLLMQVQADLLGAPIRRPAVLESTGLGAALMAGLAVGLWEGLEDIRALWRLDREFAPEADAEHVAGLRKRWERAVSLVLRAAE